MPGSPDHRAAAADRLGRPLRSLRVSVTDRCNLRCQYCMPEETYSWLPRASLLTHEEAARLVGVFSRAGVTKVRITGGEPLLRRDVRDLVAMVHALPGIRESAMTTNGLLLAHHADDLKRAGLTRLTVSLDTLRGDRYAEFARRGRLDDVLAGLEAARAAGFDGTKLNMVVVRGVNDDEVTEMLVFGRERGLEVRFIEYMDVGGATRWAPELVVPQAEILDVVRRALGTVEPLRGALAAAPAGRYRLADGTTFGVVASMSAPFCAACDRSRLTADGLWLRCLYADAGTDLKGPLREGATDDQLEGLIRAEWAARVDRGAEARREADARGPLVGLEALRRDPHREMHTRGG